MEAIERVLEAIEKMYDQHKRYINPILILSIAFATIVAGTLYYMEEDLEDSLLLFLMLLLNDLIISLVVGAILALIISQVKKTLFLPLFWKCSWYVLIVWVAAKVIVGAAALYFLSEYI